MQKFGQFTEAVSKSKSKLKIGDAFIRTTNNTYINIVIGHDHNGPITVEFAAGKDGKATPGYHTMMSGIAYHPDDDGVSDWGRAKKTKLNASLKKGLIAILDDPETKYQLKDQRVSERDVISAIKANK
jgi:hypothetical protein